MYRVLVGTWSGSNSVRGDPPARQDIPAIDALLDDALGKGDVVAEAGGDPWPADWRTPDHDAASIWPHTNERHGQGEPHRPPKTMLTGPWPCARLAGFSALWGTHPLPGSPLQRVLAGAQVDQLRFDAVHLRGIDLDRLAAGEEGAQQPPTRRTKRAAHRCGVQPDVVHHAHVLARSVQGRRRLADLGELVVASGGRPTPAPAGPRRPYRDPQRPFR